MPYMSNRCGSTSGLPSIGRKEVSFLPIHTPESKKPCMHTALSIVVYVSCWSSQVFHYSHKLSFHLIYSFLKCHTGVRKNPHSAKGMKTAPLALIHPCHSSSLWHGKYMWAATSNRQAFLGPDGWGPHRMAMLAPGLQVMHSWSMI